MAIREIEAGEGLDESVSVIRESFSGVARRFGLTQENTPSHPSFITLDQLTSLRKRGVRFFGLFEAGEQMGFVAVERADEDLYYLEKLAVLPGQRGRGHGRELIRFVFDHVKGRGGKRISIAIIDTDADLKKWYEENGFKPGKAKDFPQLPFRVRFMEKDL